MNRKIFAASDVCLSEKSNDIFMFVTMRLLSTRVNRNGDAVTAEFIDEVVEHPETYLGLPVYVDTAKLLAGDKTMGHNYNRMTGKFSTTQVGSLSNFEKVEDEYGVSLIAEARFPKREAAICEKILELYENQDLNFSFEISYVPNAVVKDNGVLYIQANEHNMLTGLAIVSVPAYEEAVALSLVAEDESVAQTNVPDAAKQEGVETMNDENKVAEVVAEAEVTETEEVVVAEETVEAVAETEPVQTEEVVAEEEAAPEATEQANADFIAPLAEVTDFALEVPPVVPVPQAEPAVDPAVVDDAQIEAAHAQIDAEVAQLRAQIAQLEAECEALRAEHVELEAYRAAKRAEELANRQRIARNFAETQGLDIADEAVASAVENVDYEKLAELVMAQSANETEEVAVASIAPAAPMNVEELSLRDRLFETDL